MANRKSSQSTAEGNRERKSKENESHSSDLAKFWSDFSTFMGSRLTEAAKGNSSMQNEWSNRWLQFYADAANSIAESMKGEQLAEVQALANVWNNYGNRMAITVNKFVAGGSGAIKSLQETWNAHVPKIGEELSKAVNGNGDTAKPSELYRMWVEFTNDELKNLMDLMGKTSTGATDILDMWGKLNADMSDIIKEVAQFDGKTYEELSKKWTKTSSLMSEEISKILDEQNGGLTKLQDIWSRYAGDMGGLFPGTAGGNGGNGFDPESMYRMYANTANQMLQALNLPPMALNARGAIPTETWKNNKEPKQSDSAKD